MPKKISSLNLIKMAVMLSDRHVRWLDVEEHRLMISKSEILRRLLDGAIDHQEYLIPRKRAKREEAERERQMSLTAGG